MRKFVIVLAGLLILSAINGLYARAVWGSPFDIVWSVGSGILYAHAVSDWLRS